MNKIFVHFTFILALIFYDTDAAARDFAMVHYTTENGIPSNTIYNIYKDSKGHLWLCSDKGIARYNGIEFENFTTSNGLPDNEIFFFKEDNYGRLWVATFNGELCYYKDGIFHNAANTTFLKLPFKKSYIQDIIIAPDSSVIIGFSDHAKWVTIQKNKCSVKSFDKIIKPFDLNFFHLNKITNNRFEILFSDKIIAIDSNSDILMKEVFTKKTYRYSISQNQQYLYTEDSIYTLNRVPLAAMNKAAYVQQRIYHIYIYNQNIFYCTDKGMYINNDIHAFEEYKVTAVERDIEGNYWVSTLGNGVFSLSKNFLSIHTYKNCYTGVIKYAKADGQYLFYATNKNNAYRLDRQGIKCLLDYSKHKTNKKTPDYQSFLIDTKNIFYIFCDTNIFLIDSIYTAHPLLKVYKGNFIGGYKSLFSDGNNIYLKRFRTIEYFNFIKPKYIAGNTTPPVIALQPYVQSKERIFGMAQDTVNTLWYSTIDSMYKIINGTSVAQSQYKNTSFKWFDILGNYLIGCTHDNKLAVCNNINGEMYFDIVAGQNCIWEKLCKLDANHFLLSTNNLYRVLTLSSSDSLPVYSIQVIENPYIPRDAEDICSNGSKCFFFKNGSITSIDIKTLLEKPAPPVLLFKILKAGNNRYPIHSEVNIPFRDARNISISFSTLAFNGAEIEYEYAVSDDENDAWIDLHGDINLIHPGYGYFTVKVRAKSISSNFSDPVYFTLHILRPYWATWWFISLSTLMLTSLLIILVRYRILSALLKKQQLHDNEIRFIKSEYKAMNALMNPHFIFNTLNNVQDLINKNDKRAANEYLRFFADLIRQNMHNISKELVSLQKELDLVTNYLLLEKLRFEDCLNYSIKVDECVDLSEIMVPPLLIQPLVENAIKHGIYPLQSTEGNIRVNIHGDKDMVHIEVMDNGVGMNVSQNRDIASHESFGLRNIKTRIEQLSLIQNKEIQFRVSNIKDENGKQLWTVITISIPLS